MNEAALLSLSQLGSVYHLKEQSLLNFVLKNSVYVSFVALKLYPTSLHSFTWSRDLFVKAQVDQRVKISSSSDSACVKTETQLYTIHSHTTTSRYTSQSYNPVRNPILDPIAI